MSSPKPNRGALVGALLFAMREVRGQLIGINQAIGDHLGLALIDMEFIDLIARASPVTPGALAKASGLSPATVTGILDRLEKDGWVRRDRDALDRRKVLINVEMKQAPKLGQLYGGMLSRMSAILGSYSERELEFLVAFLNKVRDAGSEATAELRDR